MLLQIHAASVLSDTTIRTCPQVQRQLVKHARSTVTIRPQEATRQVLASRVQQARVQVPALPLLLLALHALETCHVPLACTTTGQFVLRVRTILIRTRQDSRRATRVQVERCLKFLEPLASPCVQHVAPVSMPPPEHPSARAALRVRIPMERRTTHVLYVPRARTACLRPPLSAPDVLQEHTALRWAPAAHLSA